MRSPHVQAHDALRRGTDFLRGSNVQASLARPWTTGHAGVVRAHFVGNCLAELDRFLHVLMDELAPGLGVAASPEQRNTANKIARLTPLAGRSRSDQLRLRALGRSRACLTRCGGLMRRADSPGGSWMTAGWRGPDEDALRRYAMGDRLRPTGADVADVARFYDGVAAALVGDQMRRVPG